MADILSLAKYVQDQGEVGRQRGLSKLLGRAYGAPEDQQQQILGAVAAKGAPGMAFEAQGKFGDMRKQSFDDLGREASMFVVSAQSSDPATAQAAYQRLAQKAQAAGHPVPPNYDPKMLPMIEKLASMASGQSSELKTFDSMTAGMSPDDVAKARRIQLGLDPRAVTGAMKFGDVVGADGRPRQKRMNPTTGAVEVYDDNYGWVPLGGQAQPQGAPQPQRAPGEVPFSIDPSLPPEVQAQIRANPDAGRAQGLTELPQVSAPVTGLGTGRRPEDEAGAKAAAEEAAKLAALPERGRIEATNAGLKERATQTAQIAATAPKKEAELAAERRQKAITDLPLALQNSQQTMSVIDKALNHPGLEMATGLSSKIDPRNLYPGSPGYDFNVVMKQLKGKAFLEAFGSLKGGGQITEVEGQKATEAIARLDTAQSKPEFVAALRELRGIAQKARERALRAAQGSQQAPQGGHVDDLLSKYGVK